MKETLNVNIGSEAFVIDDDACCSLRSYLDDLRSRLPEDDTETMDDIERRIAELLRERIASPMRVVSLDAVQSVISRMGSPEEFGQRLRGGTCGGDSAQADGAEPRRLCRSRTQRSIAGVCGGIGEFFGFDPTAVRLGMLLLILVGGISIWAYLIFWIVIPEAPAVAFEFGNSKNRQRYGKQ